MSQQRTRRRIFDSDYGTLAVPMYWLSKRGVPRAEVAHIFDRTVNDVSVNATNQSIREREQPLVVSVETPDLSLASSEIDLPADSRNDDLEDRIEREAARFWVEVRGLAGTVQLNKILREINKPGKENVSRWRLRGRVEHLMAEMHLHAGYLKTAERYCRRALATRLSLYKETQYRRELFHYAKTMLLFTCAFEVGGESDQILPLLKTAEQAFIAANAPVDPELHRQRAAVLLHYGHREKARESYVASYEAFPAHREYMGLPSEDHARHDLGKRPLAVLDESLEQQLKNLEIAQQWPVADIHRSINLNTAIALAFLKDSAGDQDEMLKRLPEARVAAAGYGRQTTTVRLLELLTQIPKRLWHDWALFALRFNAYRRK